MGILARQAGKRSILLDVVQPNWQRRWLLDRPVKPDDDRLPNEREQPLAALTVVHFEISWLAPAELEELSYDRLGWLTAEHQSQSAHRLSLQAHGEIRGLAGAQHRLAADVDRGSDHPKGPCGFGTRSGATEQRRSRRADSRVGQIPWFRGDGQRRDRSGTRRRPRGGGPLEE